MLHRWLVTPDVQQWFGLPAERDRVESDISNPLLDVRIVEADSVPFGLVQDYPLHHWDQPHFADLPAGRGIACYIGEPDYYGQGHGSAFLRRRCEQLRAADVPLIAIDPGAENTRAIAAYQKAGFQNPRVRTDEDGQKVVVLTYQ